MATINDAGNIIAKCPDCRGALSTHTWTSNDKGEYGSIERTFQDRDWSYATISYRLFKCGGCGRGSLGSVIFGGDHSYPGKYRRLSNFRPESSERLLIPKDVPEGIASEFREGENCISAGCVRAAAGMFRSVLDKTLRANGYKTKPGTNLEQQINAAAEDGVITAARKKKAHDDIRVLGNDVLHDDWFEIKIEEVQLAQHYAQRILEDFYDDRDSVIQLLIVAGRLTQEEPLADA